VLQTTAGPDARHSAAALQKSEPFQTYFDVPVAGGALTVARSGPPPEAGQTVVLGLHGMTSCHMVYRTIARELCDDARPVCMLAPDLRGRGRSAHLPEPYGIAVHLADLIAVLDHAGADRAIVVGHSMGSNIAARFAADHPERTAAVVLIDSGTTLRRANRTACSIGSSRPSPRSTSTWRTGMSIRRSRAPGTRTSRPTSTATTSRTRTACAAS
jgi:pimeloyl-ACP methyl ester carboxylesterase